MNKDNKRKKEREHVRVTIAGQEPIDIRDVDVEEGAEALIFSGSDGEGGRKTFMTIETIR